MGLNKFGYVFLYFVKFEILDGFVAHSSTIKTEELHGHHEPVEEKQSDVTH